VIGPAKLLAFAYLALRKVLWTISDDRSVDWRAMGLLICTQIGLVLCILEFASVIEGRRLLPAQGPRLVQFAVLVSSAITAFNYYVVRYKNKWKQFDSEFESYSKLTQNISGVAMIILTLLTAAALVWLAASVARLPP
jgi:hypothetical protein